MEQPYTIGGYPYATLRNSSLKLKTEMMPDDNVRNSYDHVNLFNTDHIFINTCC